MPAEQAEGQDAADLADEPAAAAEPAPRLVGEERLKRVQDRAYALWRDEGCLGGRDIHYWLRAEEEIAAEFGPA